MPNLQKVHDVDFSRSYQNYLSKCQAIPLFGPCFVSPIKAGTGLVEIIVGGSLALSCGAVAKVTKNRDSKELAFRGVAHLVIGSIATGYAIVNFATLGIIGCAMERKSSSPF
jgi:hypothetical protein